MSDSFCDWLSQWQGVLSITFNNYILLFLSYSHINQATNPEGMEVITSDKLRFVTAKQSFCWISDMSTKVVSNSFC